MKLSTIIRYTIIIFITIFSTSFIEQIQAHESDVYEADQDNFYPPNRTTPEYAVKTFWWALRHNNEFILKECIDENRILEDYPGWSLDMLLENYKYINPKNFTYQSENNIVSIISTEHIMNYHVDLDDEGQWIIVAIRP